MSTWRVVVAWGYAGLLAVALVTDQPGWLRLVLLLATAATLARCAATAGWARGLHVVRSVRRTT